MNKAAKFWVGVACKEHVENSIKLGICQFCHGKSAPAKRLSRGDFVIHYSSKISMAGSIHGDFAIGNMLMDGEKLSSIINFGGVAVGNPACDLVIAWTYLDGKAHEIFMNEMALDGDTWLRARAWTLWKATFELCQIADKNSPEALLLKRVIDEVMNEK